MIRLYTILLAFLFLSGTVLANDELEKNGSIKGHVQTSDAKPGAFVTVSLKNTKKGTMTDENGNFRLHGVKPGTYTLRISHIGLQTEEQEIKVEKVNKPK
ncbi:carboxypeptidase-like regulatory domain-containing protein [Mucilaginibacter terrae]|uniref:Carboxypeptidase-like regulatory domain-containing protein n=1 Tax=Mucilaginibacter terrae TaxID=1955052 RepID=A0ABU3GX52_9SPHI|nr:carboxypeptidase-like regulatory domain-containing protein [Mucilaginibacter terrae]MDT3403250.1 hypothetical protein [Mucilaginibacter terrae]